MENPTRKANDGQRANLVTATAELEKIVEDLVKAVTTEGNTRVVFGEPLALENHHVIPVATVQIGFGGGIGGSRLARLGAAGKVGEAFGKLLRLGFGGGGGGGIKVIPVGFICERGEDVRFEPIPIPPAH